MLLNHNELLLENEDLIANNGALILECNGLKNKLLEDKFKINNLMVQVLSLAKKHRISEQERNYKKV
ncbi:hypothetical protein PNK_1170 [Candidatus Protochlamydia naegleriophila]|uniref:Uncharacterized protein n=1 Tax=Candidatus Protochlamydia naegleriophila TaxID=389348 RepID=A0A0U5ERI8_9BACT|nr:hypothetical protein PNK_1170 [Candidatus Protochlamydia naegleriophila]